MLSQFNQFTKASDPNAPEIANVPEIKCDKWREVNQKYLKAKDKDGAQGGYKNYTEYVLYR